MNVVAILDRRDSKEKGEVEVEGEEDITTVTAIRKVRKKMMRNLFRWYVSIRPGGLL